MTLPVHLGDGQVRHFILDTGATRFALFEDRLPATLGTPDATGRAFRIHGMFGASPREGITFESVRIGTDAVGAHRFAVLPPRKAGTSPHLRARDPALMAVEPAGLIGMDLLARYRLFVPEGGGVIVLLDADAPAPRPPAHWGRVKLGPNPFSVSGATLPFMRVRVGGRVADALLDTGSSFNLMSWSLADWPQLRNAAASWSATTNCKAPTPPPCRSSISAMWTCARARTSGSTRASSCATSTTSPFWGSRTRLSWSRASTFWRTGPFISTRARASCACPGTFGSAIPPRRGGAWRRLSAVARTPT